MSKSTPLSQLRSNNQQPQQNQESNENMLVNEILQEIEGSQAQLPMAPQQQQQLQPEPQPVLELPPQQVPMNNVQMNIENNADYFPDTIQFNTEQESKGFVSQLLDSVKMSIVVGALIVLFSISSVSRILSRIIPERLPFISYRTQIILLLKFILGSVSYFAVSKIL